MRHIAKEYKSIESLCGEQDKAPEFMHYSIDALATCKKCRDMYYKQNPTSDCYTNPYFRVELLKERV